MKIRTISINNLELVSSDNIEFLGEYKNKPFKVLKDINSETGEFEFTLDVKQPGDTHYKILGSFPTLEECIQTVKE